MANPYVFNPPPASEMADDELPKRLPYELRRESRGMGVRMRRERRVVVENGRHRNVYNGPEHYYRACRRSTSARLPCNNEIEVYRVVTGTRMEVGDVGQSRHPVTDYVYYWPDTAIVVETGTEYGARTVQAGFCSWKCLSLFAAKIARDTEQ